MGMGSGVISRAQAKGTCSSPHSLILTSISRSVQTINDGDSEGSLEDNFCTSSDIREE